MLKAPVILRMRGTITPEAVMSVVCYLLPLSALTTLTALRARRVQNQDAVFAGSNTAVVAQRVPALTQGSLVRAADAMQYQYFPVDRLHSASSGRQKSTIQKCSYVTDIPCETQNVLHHLEIIISP